ncbi:MAG TPA: hypothetical protein VIV60_10440 [Polyangiaceae bacterium]
MLTAFRGLPCAFFLLMSCGRTELDAFSFEGNGVSTSKGGTLYRTSEANVTVSTGNGGVSSDGRRSSPMTSPSGGSRAGNATTTMGGKSIAMGGRSPYGDAIATGGNSLLGSTSSPGGSLARGGAVSAGGSSATAGALSAAGAASIGGRQATGGASSADSQTFAGSSSTSGTVDINGYCQSIGYSGAILDSANAYGWQCYTISGIRAALSMTAACNWQYGLGTTIDRMLDYWASDSWRCSPTPNQLGTPDLDGYCRSKGFTGVILVGSTAYDWRCHTETGTLVMFSPTAACTWTYASPNAIDRTGDYFNPNAWTCWD